MSESFRTFYVALFVVVAVVEVGHDARQQIVAVVVGVVVGAVARRHVSSRHSLRALLLHRECYICKEVQFHMINLVLTHT